MGRQSISFTPVESAHQGKLRILIAGDYPLDPDHITGGVEAVIVYLARALSRLPDLEVEVLSLSLQVGEPRQAMVDGLPVHHLPSARGLGPLYYFMARRQLVRHMRALAPDLIHAHIAGVYADAALRSGIPTLLTPHGITYREMEIKYPAWPKRVYHSLPVLAERSTIRRARYLIAISPYILKAFDGRIDEGEVFHIENPIDDRWFDLPNREVAGRLLYAGTISPRKALLDLLRAIHQVRDAVPHLELRVAGGEGRSYADYAAQARRFVAEHHLEEQVTFLGHLDEERLLEEYATCSLLVLPSRQETAPMVVQQAMAAGKPVVATTVGGIPHLIHDGATGLLVAPGDTAALGEAIVRLLQDEALRRRMGQQAKQEAEERFRASRVAARTREVYHHVIQQVRVAGEISY